MRRMSLAARTLWILFVCLPLLAACDQASATAPSRSATPRTTVSSSAVPAMQTVALVYTYFGHKSDNSDSGVAGGSALDGAQVWHTAIGHVNYPPIIVGNTLYLCVRAPGDTAQNIVAVRIADGQLLWTTPLPSESMNYVLTADSTTVVVNAGIHGLYALDPDTGTIRWHLSLRLEHSKPGLHAGVVSTFVTHKPFDPPMLAAFRASDGAQLWAVPYGAYIGSRIELTSTAAFGSTLLGFADGPHVVAFSLRDGHVLWSSQSAGFVLAATPHAIFVESTTYQLEALSPANGTLLWQVPVLTYYSVAFDAVPIVNGVLYLSNATEFVAVRVSDGALAWRTSDLQAAPKSVMVVNGVAYLLRQRIPPPDGSQGGGCVLTASGCPDEIVALNSATGRLLWHRALQHVQLLAQPIPDVSD